MTDYVDEFPGEQHRNGSLPLPLQCTTLSQQIDAKVKELSALLKTVEARHDGMLADCPSCRGTLI